MRASTSWPRSSVPSGWVHEGGCSLALKSISLIGTRQRNGPSAMAAMIASTTTALTTASRWRRKRRHDSCHGEKRCLRRSGTGTATATGGAATAGASAERDAGVKPAIDDIGDKVAEDDEAGEHEGDGHHHRRVVG